MKRLVVAVVLSLALVRPAPAAPSPAPPNARPEDVRRLMKITGVSAEMEQLEDFFAKTVVEGIHRDHPDLPPEALQDLQKGIQEVLAKHVDGPDGLIARVMELYQRHFTRDDIEGLIRFYESPLGRKWIQERPLLMKDMMAVSRDWGMSLGPELEKRIEASLQKYGVSKP